MTLASTDNVIIAEPSFPVRMMRMLLADKFALCAAIFLLVILTIAIIGPPWLGDLATKQNLRGRNLPPFDWTRTWSGGWGPTRSAVRSSPASSWPLRTP